MSSINYELEIIGEKKKYSPRNEFITPIITSKKRIFEITADNSYGKTFILNLLAYALEADKLGNEKILETIKSSISRYDESSSYKLEYNIQLDLPDDKILSLSKKKGEGKLIQIDGSPPIGYNTLHKNLSVIYDVPTNPSERLKAVINDLSNWNNRLENKIKNTTRYFNDITKEFDSVRDEEKITDLKEKLSNQKKEISNQKNKIDDKEKLLSDILKIINLKNLNLLLKKKLELEGKIARKTKVFKTLKKPSKIEKKDETIIKELNSELANTNRNFKDIISKLIRNINNDSEISQLIIDDNNNNKQYSLIKNTDLLDAYNNDDYIKINNSILEAVYFVRDEILRFISEKKNDESYIIHNSYKQFISLLEELMENKIDHLLNTVTTVDSGELKKHLESIINKHKVKNFNALKSFLENDLKTVKGLMAQFGRTKSKLIKESKKKMVDDDESNYYKIHGELKDLKDSLKKVKNNFDLTRANCANDLNINDLNRLDSIEKISDFSLSIKNNIEKPSLLDEINNSKGLLEKEIRELNNKREQLKTEKGMTTVSLDREQAKNTSKYNDEQKEKIKMLRRALMVINNNLISFKQVITKIDTGVLNEFNDQEDILFMELAGRIIAYSMDNKLLRADGKFVKLNFYDMVKQNFHCDGDMIIKKDDVSTGLASANYLKQRIDNVDGEYVVVLLDEIGNMAQNAIDKVIESIKSLEKQNRLVLAVLTRPRSKGIKVIEY